ncbi:MAG: hypothetical protein KDD11_04125, partial [Acidobacteria bacterium]|nr:hypothetical protein [Acidobacteriota bacterium]
MRLTRCLMLALAFLALCGPGVQAATDAVEKLKPQMIPPPAGPDLDLARAVVEYLPDLELLVFEAEVAGTAGRTVPEPRGSMDGAPVLGYVFPTTLQPSDV